MTLRCLLTIGDSWPAGDELDNPKSHAFPVIVAKELGIESLNLAEPATSSDQSFYKLLNLPDSITDWKQTLVLFCLTGISRSMVIDNGPVELYPANTTSRDIAYYKYIQSDELDIFNRIKIILCAQQFCRWRGCSILFVNNWDATPTHKVIDQSLFYHKTLLQILNIPYIGKKLEPDFRYIRSNKFIAPNVSHPNVNGHAVIAKELINWIKEKNESIP